MLGGTGVLVFHIAGRSDWAAAQRGGRYFAPGFDDRGRLDAHLSAVREGHWEDVRRREFADAFVPLVLLEIDTERLTSPVQEVGSAYRILGPVNADAVVGVRDLPRSSASEIAGAIARETARDFGGEMLFWVTLLAVFALSVLGLAAIGYLLVEDPGGVIGGVIGMGVATTLVVLWLRRRAEA